MRTNQWQNFKRNRIITNHFILTVANCYKNALPFLKTIRQGYNQLQAEINKLRSTKPEKSVFPDPNPQAVLGLDVEDPVERDEEAPGDRADQVDAAGHVDPLAEGLAEDRAQRDRNVDEENPNENDQSVEKAVDLQKISLRLFKDQQLKRFNNKKAKSLEVFQTGR